MNNNNKPSQQILSLIKYVSVNTFAMALLFNSSFTNSQDLANNTDLKESSLSLSLTPSTLMAINAQQHQVTISQYGILNRATIKQLANASNSISINQDGFNNQVSVEQFGYGNSVNIEQLGSYNLAGVIQEGNANVANITQSGEQTFVVHQIGNDMVVNITQY